MAYTLATVRQRVIDQLDDEEANTTLINNYINDTQRSIFNNYRLPINEKTFSGTLTVDEDTYDLRATATKFQRLIGLRLTSPDANEADLTEDFQSYSDFRRDNPDPSSQDSGLPGKWTLFANKIYFNKPVDVAYTMDMDYLSAATTLSDDSDVPEIPEEFQELLVLGALIRYMEFNEDNDLAEFHRSKPEGYTDQLTSFINRYYPRQVGKTNRMRNSARRR